MPARGRRADKAPPAQASFLDVQTDLFPEQPVIDDLDPRTTVGPRTGVLALMRVVLRSTEAPHMVFHDRHGWYCEEHGPTCAAVGVARDAAMGP